MSGSQSEESVKLVTEKEIRHGRISVPQAWIDSLFPYVAENTKTQMTMVDENGDSYEVDLKFREVTITKPELFISGGWKKFAQERNLQANDILIFSPGTSPADFRICVKDISHRRPQTAYPELVANLAAVHLPERRPAAALFPYPGLSSHHHSLLSV